MDFLNKKYFPRKITLSDDGRLDQILRKEAKEDLSFLTRSSWKKLFQEGWILDDSGRKLSPGDRLSKDLPITIQFPVPRLGLIPSEIPVQPPLFISKNKRLMIFLKDPELHSYPNLPWKRTAFLIE